MKRLRFTRKSLTLLIAFVLLLGLLVWYFLVDYPKLPQLGSDEFGLKSGVKHSVELSDIVKSGVSKDGVPSIDKPKFISISKADQALNDDELVIKLSYQGVTRGYPLKILRWHEVVNDQIDNLPLLISYCPRTGSDRVYKRQVKNENLEFGVSGRVYNNNLLLYDRKTESLWAQSSGYAVTGEYTGQALEPQKHYLYSWGKFKKLFSDAQVLSQDTGYFRSYNINPYHDYETSESIYYPTTYGDSKLHSKEVVYGLGDSGKYLAVTAALIQKDKLVNSTVGELKVVVIFDENEGIVRSFNRILDSEELSFEIKSGKIKDSSGSVWDEKGKAISGKYKDKELTEIVPQRSYWFAWVAFYPETELIN